jgi:hypothetical protein
MSILEPCLRSHAADADPLTPARSAAKCQIQLFAGLAGRLMLIWTAVDPLVV